MANELDTLMANVASVVDAVSGIASATSEPKEKPAEGLFAIVFLFSARFVTAPIGTKRCLATVAVDLLKVRKDLPRDLDVLTPYTDSITAALMGEIADGGGRFSNAMETMGDISVVLLPEVWYAGVQMIGYRFLIGDVKILVNL